jgi:hypothetical protein
MMKIVLFLFLVVLAESAQSQTVLKVIALDKMTKDPVQHATVFVSEGTQLARSQYSNRGGVAYFSVSGSDSVHITCNHTAYAADTRTFSPKELNRDTLKVTVYMRFEKSTTFDEVFIRPQGVPVPVYKSDRLSVDDFEFLPDGSMLLLTYAKNKKKGTELYLYDALRSEVRSEIPLQNEEYGLELIRDYRGNPHVVTDKSVYGITAAGNQVEVGLIDKQYFMTYIAPIVDTTVSKYFFSNYNPIYPAFDYFSFDAIDSSYKKIAKVEDELMMELFRSEYKWVDVRTKIWAEDMEQQSGIDAEIWVGATYFTQSVYYKELYAPLFKRNDTICLFDHYKNLLFRYNAQGDPLDSIPIFYHLQPKQSGWQKQLIQDQITGQVYIIYEKAGQCSLRRIDLSTGDLKEAIPLHYKYVENILIRDNKVYYTYRPFETAQKKYLYEERLPLNHPPATVQQGDDLVKKTH